MSTAEQGDRRYERQRAREVAFGPSLARRLRAVVEAIFSRHGEGEALAAPPAERVAWVCREFDDALCRVSGTAHATLALSLLVVTTLAPFFVRRLGGFVRMPLEDRVRALDLFEKSPLAPALLAIKGLFSVHYYEHPDAAREVGFDGACMKSEAEP